MFSTLRNAWKIKELRKKILFTIFVIFVFRIGCAIPVPFIDAASIKTVLQLGESNIFTYLNMMTGSALSQATIFAMSISPYINASIIIQLLTIGIPALERLSKTGEEGKKKLSLYTRYLTIALGMLQGYGYYKLLDSYQLITKSGFLTGLVIVMTFTAGTAFLMWLADLVSDKGVGNGISIILFAGIVSRLPLSLAGFWPGNNPTNGGWKNFGNDALFFGIIIGVLVLIMLVVIFNDAERRIPIQYAKRVSGRKMYGGQSTNLPIKVLLTGVLPIIFASAIISIPGTIATFTNPAEGSFWASFFKVFSYTHPVYATLEFLLIIFFSYFYAAVQYNPIEISNNIKDNGGFIPGIRPGKPSADFITKVLNKVIIVGALFLGLVAIIPIAFASFTNASLALGGTSLLIVVGVALETVKQIESQMIMRHYKGFLE